MLHNDRSNCFWKCNFPMSPLSVCRLVDLLVGWSVGLSKFPEKKYLSYLLIKALDFLHAIFLGSNESLGDPLNAYSLNVRLICCLAVTYLMSYCISLYKPYKLYLLMREHSNCVGIG